MFSPYNSNNGMHHPDDSILRRKFDDMFPEFGKVLRNIRLDLTRMNSFGNLSTNYTSTTRKTRITYRLLHTDQYMKQKYMMLSMMICGPRKPENDRFLSKSLN